MYKIIIVDDEPIIRSGLQKLVEQSGVPIASLRTATNGVQALELIEEDRPDFLFTDIRMPKMDGATFLHQAVVRRPETTRILLTGQADRDEAIRAVNQGQIFRFLTKPFGSAELARAIDELFASR